MISRSSSSLDRPSLHTTNRSPGVGGSTHTSGAGAGSEPSERVMTLRIGCRAASDASMRPASISSRTSEWSRVTRLITLSATR